MIVNLSVVCDGMRMPVVYVQYGLFNSIILSVKLSYVYMIDRLSIHCKKGNVSLTCSLSFWMQMSEQITHMDSDNYYSGMRMRRGTRYERGKVCYEVPLCK